MTITSTSNSKIKQVRALQARSKARHSAQAFVVEGVRLAEEALEASMQPQLVLHADGLSPRGLEIVEKFRDQNTVVEQVAEHVMQAVSETQTPQGLLLVLSIQPQPFPLELDFLLIADQVRNPGNLGTIIRGAASAGVQAVILAPGTADPYAPKVLRAAMGAHFRIPIIQMNWEAIQEKCEAYELRVYLAAAGEGAVYTQAYFSTPLALIIGGEAAGASQAAQLLAPQNVHIPMPGGGESLNVGMASSILMFEIVRQRNKSFD
ncbi:MAG: RNA methyltransferase [Chloroflexi bacterium]|nr:RNA methyltransferase [Chloroflexota bacterium]